MRVVVVKEFIDKYDRKFHPVGEKMDVTEERFAEIGKKGTYVVDISDEVAADPVEVAEEPEKVAEPVEQTEPEKPATKGRRSRVKKESEDK